MAKKVIIEKEKSWFRRHWILAIIIIIIVVFFLLGIIGSLSRDKANTNSKDAWYKTSNYTVNDCYKVCDEVYDIQIQVSICQNNCDDYGKPSVSLDKYVNTIKDIKNKK